MNKPVAWAIKADNDFTEIGFDDELLEEIEQMYVMEGWKYEVIPLYTHPVKELTDEDIAKVVHELNKKANTPERWVTAMQIGAETIIQLRDELAILRKAQEK